MTTPDQILIRQFRRMLAEQRKISNLNIDQLLIQLDDMELQSIKEGEVNKVVEPPLYTVLTPNGRKDTQ